MRRKVRRCLLPPLLATASAISNAQSAPSDGIETVIITAQHRSEPLQDVPIAVKAFSARQIEDAGIRSTQDFIDLTPNVALDQSFTYRNSFVTMRGVAQVNNADAPVAVVVDGIPQGNQKQLKMNLFDIERIEVLKGPQGALYGRNAIGGVINIETRAPVSHFESRIDAQYGSGNTRELTASVNDATAQGTASFRLTAQARRSDGTISNDYLNRNVDAIEHDDTLRAKASFHVASGVRLDAVAAANNFAGGATWDSLVRSGNPNDIVAPRSSLLGKTDGNGVDIGLKAEIDMQGAMLTAITGYSDLTERYRGDLDFSNPGDPRGGLLGPLPIQLGQGQDLSAHMFSQEIRLTSAADRPVRWIVGSYFLKTERDLDTRAFVDTNGELSQWDDSAKTAVRLAESNENKAYAVFGQFDADLDSRTTLSTALRYDRDERNQTNVENGEVRRANFSAWQPKFTLTHHVDRNRLVYATWSTGFRSGGFNAPGLPMFRAENLRNLEAGYKSVLLDRRLVFNAAAFYARSSDFQFFYVDVPSASQVISNIDRVDIRGADIDVYFRPSASLELDGGLGIADSAIRANALDPATVGNHSPKTVPWKLNFAAQYSRPVSATTRAVVRLDVEHRAKKYWHADNVAVSNPLDLFNLRLGIRDATGKWSAELFCHNLSNKKYYADYNSSRYTGGKVDVGSLAPGRTFGVDMKFRFD